MTPIATQLAQYVDLIAEMALARHKMQNARGEAERDLHAHSLTHMQFMANELWAELSRSR